MNPMRVDTSAKHQERSTLSAPGSAPLRRSVSVINRGSPWLTLLALVALSWWLPNRSQASEESQRHKAEVAAALEAAPYFIGPWVGKDAADAIPREAQQLLRPNALFSRSYTAPHRAPIHVLLVHCGDARDMIGHFPPICYPSSGWIELPARGAEIHWIDAGGRTIPVREYVFSRPRDAVTDEVIRVFNAFIIPGGQVTPRFDDINRLAERLAISMQGVAQLQLITRGSVPLEEALAAAGELLGGMSGVLDALQGGSMTRIERTGAEHRPIAAHHDAERGATSAARSAERLERIEMEGGHT